MSISENLRGIIPSFSEPKVPFFQSTPIIDEARNRNISMQAQALPPNHSSRDMSPQQLRISPTSRNRRGNKEHSSHVGFARGLNLELVSLLMIQCMHEYQKEEH